MDLETLRQFEGNFKTALNEGYARNVGNRNLELIEEASGIKCDNKTCNTCVLDFLKRVGRQYYKEVQERIELTPIEKARLAKMNKKATNK